MCVADMGTAIHPSVGQALIKESGVGLVAEKIMAFKTCEWATAAHTALLHALSLHVSLLGALLPGRPLQPFSLVHILSLFLSVCVRVCGCVRACVYARVLGRIKYMMSVALV